MTPLDFIFRLDGKSTSKCPGIPRDGLERENSPDPLTINASMEGSNQIQLFQFALKRGQLGEIPPMG